MKVNEAPEKIYLNWVNYPLEEMQVEYTRTDAFIEKAVRFLKIYRVCLEGHKDWFIEQFKKYIEE